MRFRLRWLAAPAYCGVIVLAVVIAAAIAHRNDPPAPTLPYAARIASGGSLGAADLQTIVNAHRAARDHDGATAQRVVPSLVLLQAGELVTVTDYTTVDDVQFVHLRLANGSTVWAEPFALAP